MLKVKCNLTKYLGNNFTYYNSPNAVTSNTSPVMKVDSGATKTYIKPTHQHHLRNVIQLKNGPVATLPNNTKIQASAQGNLSLHSELNIKSLIYPQLASESLLSVGQICDTGCLV